MWATHLTFDVELIRCRDKHFNAPNTTTKHFKAVFVPTHEEAEVDVEGHEDEDDDGEGGDMVQVQPPIVQPAHHLVPPGEAGRGQGGRHVRHLMLD